MTLNRVASELDETARLSASLSDSIGAALQVLSARSGASDADHGEAIRRIVIALQTEDRVAQRCQHLAVALRQFAELPPGSPPAVEREIWTRLPMEELRGPQDRHPRDAELF